MLLFFLILGSVSSQIFSQEVPSVYKNFVSNFKSYNLYVSKKSAILRTNPTIYSMEIAVLQKGENVKVLYQIPKKVRIGIVEDYWYYVQTSKGYLGWIFGSFLSKSTDLQKEEFIDKNIVNNHLKGIWWEINEKGETEYRSLEFNLDQEKTFYGKFVYKFQNTSKIEGEFFINDKGMIELDKSLPIGKELTFIETPEGYRLIAENNDKKYYFKKSNLELPEQENDQ